MINKLLKLKRVNRYLYFFLKFILLLFFLFSFDFIIGGILRKWYFKQESGFQYRTTYAIEKTTADVLIFGSSRANHHYHPEVFENRLQLSFYNDGRDGNFILYHNGIQKAILKRYTPKIILLDIVTGEFLKDKESYDRLSCLLPYYKSHPEMHPTIELRSKYERLKLLSKIYPYNSSIFTIAIGNTELNKKRSRDIKGYVPLSNELNQKIKTQVYSENYELDSIKVNAFESFIKDCTKSGVKLFIVCSPNFFKSFNTDYSIFIAKEIAKKNNIDFFDYSNDSSFYNYPKLFADTKHLNDQGARIFSNSIIDRINK